MTCLCAVGFGEATGAGQVFMLKHYITCISVSTFRSFKGRKHPFQGLGLSELAEKPRKMKFPVESGRKLLESPDNSPTSRFLEK